HDIVHDERRPAHAPAQVLIALESIHSPFFLAVVSGQAGQPAGGAEGEHVAVGDSRSRPRAVAAGGLREPTIRPGRPRFFARGRLVANNHLLVAALFDGDQKSVSVTESCVPATDRLTPNLLWRTGRPVAGNRGSGRDAIPIRAAIAGPVARLD